MLFVAFGIPHYEVEHDREVGEQDYGEEDEDEDREPEVAARRTFVFACSRVEFRVEPALTLITQYPPIAYFTRTVLPS